MTLKKFRRMFNKDGDTAAAAEVALRAIRESADAFPPLQSVAAALIVLWEMSKKIKSNKDDCKQLAERAQSIVEDTFRQTRDYGSDARLPVEVQHGIDQIERVFHDITALMKDLQSQSKFRSVARQDRNKTRIDEYHQDLNHAIDEFSLSLQMSILRLNREASERMTTFQVELDDVSRERHSEVLGVSKMSGAEREMLIGLHELVSRYGKISIGVFFFYS